MSSSASGSTSFCASSSAPSGAEACLLRILFGCEDLVQVSLHCATCAVVVYFARLAWLLMSFLLSFSWKLQVIHSPSNDVRAAWWRTGKNLPFHGGPSFDSLPSCARPGFFMLIPKTWLTSCWCRQWPLAYQWTWKLFFATAKQTTLHGTWLFCNYSSSACSVTCTWMARNSTLKTHHESRATCEDYTTAVGLCSWNVHKGSSRTWRRTCWRSKQSRFWHPRQRLRVRNGADRSVNTLA